MHGNCRLIDARFLCIAVRTLDFRGAVKEMHTFPNTFSTGGVKTDSKPLK
jgi:hypothetical protein